MKHGPGCCTVFDRMLKNDVIVVDYSTYRTRFYSVPLYNSTARAIPKRELCNIKSF